MTSKVNSLLVYMFMYWVYVYLNINSTVKEQNGMIWFLTVITTTILNDSYWYWKIAIMKNYEENCKKLHFMLWKIIILVTITC